MTIEEMLVELKANGFIIFPPIDPSSKLPEPDRGQIWVCPNPRVVTRTVYTSGSPWVTCFTEPGKEPRNIPRGSFLAWARRNGARPVVLPEAKPKVEEPTQQQGWPTSPKEPRPSLAVVEYYPIEPPLWRRLLRRCRGQEQSVK